MILITVNMFMASIRESSLIDCDNISSLLSPLAKYSWKRDDILFSMSHHNYEIKALPHEVVVEVNVLFFLDARNSGKILKDPTSTPLRWVILWLKDHRHLDAVEGT